MPSPPWVSEFSSCAMCMKKESVLFQTRWAMNYLAGPMTRIQIPALNALAGAESGTSASSYRLLPRQRQKPRQLLKWLLAGKTLCRGHARARRFPEGFVNYLFRQRSVLRKLWKLPEGVLPLDATATGLLYKPQIFAQAGILYNARKYGIQDEKEIAFLVQEPNSRGSCGLGRLLLSIPSICGVWTMNRRIRCVLQPWISSCQTRS